MINTEDPAQVQDASLDANLNPDLIPAMLATATMWHHRCTRSNDVIGAITGQMTIDRLWARLEQAGDRVLDEMAAEVVSTFYTR